MSIANDLTDVIEASGDMPARLAIFADHIPDEWISAAAALSEKVTTGDLAMASSSPSVTMAVTR